MYAALSSFLPLESIQLMREDYSKSREQPRPQEIEPEGEKV
jgi:hypothetical protein